MTRKRGSTPPSLPPPTSGRRRARVVRPEVPELESVTWQEMTAAIEYLFGGLLSCSSCGALCETWPCICVREREAARA